VQDGIEQIITQYKAIANKEEVSMCPTFVESTVHLENPFEGVKPMCDPQKHLRTDNELEHFWILSTRAKMPFKSLE
jgi:hypothetical protein